MADKDTAKKPAAKKMTEKKPAAKTVATATNTAAKKEAPPKKVAPVKQAVVEKAVPKKAKQSAKTYYYGTGRRKTSTARVFLMEGAGDVLVNGQALASYFPKDSHWVQSALSPLAYLDVMNKFDVMITVKGGGLTGQADAIKLGIARALVEFEEKTTPIVESSDAVVLPWRRRLRKNGYLTRDSREVLRKLVGLVKSRKAKQFSKR